MIKFYYFKNSDYIIRVHPFYVDIKRRCWAKGLSIGISVIKKEITEIYYNPCVLWDRATKKDWYKAIRGYNEKG